MMAAHGSSKRHFDDGNGWEEERYTRNSSSAAIDSVRQARTILKTVKQTERNDDGVTIEVQQVMNTELSEMIAQLKKQKDEAEQRLRNSETEATRLRIEKEASARHIAELESMNMQSQQDLMWTQQEAHHLHAKNTVTVAETEAETIRVAAELEQVRRERDAMSKMISKLEKAKSTMENKLYQVQDEASFLREENAMAMHHVQMAENEKLELQAKLASIENARADIESRLLEAELEAKSLKALKKAKALDIRTERSSAHVRPSYLNEMEAERKAISKDLKKMEEEKEQMKEMLEKLNASRKQLTSLMEGDDGDDEMSFPQEDLSNASNYKSSGSAIAPASSSRYYPALATIQSPRNIQPTLGGERPAGWLGNEIANRSFNNLLQQSMPVDPSYQDRVDPNYQIRQESAILREKRGNARRSEQRLREKMEKSRSAQSLGSVGSSLGSSYSNGLGAGGNYQPPIDYQGNAQW
jgi:hypothetical protein